MISASPEFILMKFRGTAVLQARRAISMDLSTSAGLMEGVYLETLDKGKEDVWALVAGEGLPRLLPGRRPGSLCYSSFPESNCLMSNRTPRRDPEGRDNPGLLKV